MKDRVEVARFIERQMHYTYQCSREKGDKAHYGWQELRELMDFIYESPPVMDEEFVRTSAQLET